MGAGGDAPRPVSPPRRRRRRAVAVLGALAVGFGLWATLVEPVRLEVTEHVVGSGPTALTLVHLTDLHVSAIGRRERRVLEAVAAAKPDLVCVTGDTVTALEGLRTEPVTELLAALVAQKPRLGVFACPGNHEDWAGPEAAACYERAGVPLLADRSVALLGGRLVVHGIAGPRPLPGARFDTPGYDVVLCHYPTVLPRIAGPGVELVLAGHTHGGQVCLPGGHAIVLPFESGEFVGGWFEDRGTRLFVSRGVGTTALPVRAFCRPEVAVLRLDLVPR